MTDYSVTPDNHAQFVVEITEHRGIPVLIHKGGHYPSINANGERIERLIEVADYYDGWHVTAAFGYHNSYRRALRVGIVKTLEEARLLFDAAVEAIETGPTQYAQADELSRQYQCGPLTRAEYEALATELGLEVKPDTELSEWGVFSFPEYALAVLPERWVEQRRAYTARREEEAAEEEARKAKAVADEALRERLKAQPVTRTYERFVPVASSDTWMVKGKLYTVVKRGRPRRITEDDPSVHGEHLLGAEGLMGQVVTIEVREV